GPMPIPRSRPGWCTHSPKRARTSCPRRSRKPTRAPRRTPMRPEPLRVAVALCVLLGAGCALAAGTDGAARIAALDPARRAALERRAAEWDALPLPMQRERREAWLAWRDLPAPERARMQAARAAWRSLPVDRQQALRARFDALD